MKKSIIIRIVLEVVNFIVDYLLQLPKKEDKPNEKDSNPRNEN